MKKITIIPETISELGKKKPTEPRLNYNLRLRESTINRLREKSREYGYTQQEIVDKALEAYLK